MHAPVSNMFSEKGEREQMKYPQAGDVICDDQIQTVVGRQGFRRKHKSASFVAKIHGGSEIGVLEGECFCQSAGAF